MATYTHILDSIKAGDISALSTPDAIKIMKNHSFAVATAIIDCGNVDLIDFIVFTARVVPDDSWYMYAVGNGKTEIMQWIVSNGITHAGDSLAVAAEHARMDSLDWIISKFALKDLLPTAAHNVAAAHGHLGVMK